MTSPAVDEPLYIFGVLHDAMRGSLRVRCEGCGTSIYLSEGSQVLIEERDKAGKRTIVVCVNCGAVAQPENPKGLL